LYGKASRSSHPARWTICRPAQPLADKTNTVSVEPMGLNIVNLLGSSLDDQHVST
jgi:hypothetical protein